MGKEKTRQPSSSHVATAVATSKKNVQVENRGAPRGALTDRSHHGARVRACFHTVGQIKSEAAGRGRASCGEQAAAAVATYGSVSRKCCPARGPRGQDRRAPVCAPPSVGLSGLLHSLRSPPRLHVATRHHICSHLLQCYRREAGILGEGRAPPPHGQIGRGQLKSDLMKMSINQEPAASHTSRPPSVCTHDAAPPCRATPPCESIATWHSQGTTSPTTSHT